MSPLPLLPTQTPPLPSLPFSPSSFSSPSHAHPLTLYPPPSPPIAIFILRPPAYTFIHNWCMEESLFDTLVVHVWISVTMSGVLFFFSHMCVRACVRVRIPPTCFWSLGLLFCFHLHFTWWFISTIRMDFSCSISRRLCCWLCCLWKKLDYKHLNDLSLLITYSWKHFLATHVEGILTN